MHRIPLHSLAGKKAVSREAPAASNFRSCLGCDPASSEVMPLLGQPTQGERGRWDPLRGMLVPEPPAEATDGNVDAVHLRPQTSPPLSSLHRGFICKRSLTPQTPCQCVLLYTPACSGGPSGGVKSAAQVCSGDAHSHAADTWMLRGKICEWLIL